MLTFIPYLLLVLIPFIAGLILFFRIRQSNLILLKSFFWNYAFGFSIISLFHLPAFFINLGAHLTYNALRIIDIVSLGALFLGYVLFYRGTMSLLTKDRFIITIFPLLFLPLAAGIAIASLFILEIETIIAYTAVAWGFIFPFNFCLAALFLYFFFSGAPFDTMKRRPCALILSLGWFSIFASHILLWANAVTYHPEFWILKVTSLGKEYLLLALGYLLILIGSLLCCRHLKEFKIPEKE